MTIHNLGLLNTLGAIINEGETNSDYAFTNYILKNINRINNVTVNEIVDNAYTSRSSIRRSCNKLGYNNFSEFKSKLTGIIFPSNIHLRTFKNAPDYRNELNIGLEEMISDINNVVTDEYIEYLVDLIHESDEIVFLSANNTSSNLIKFQQELFYAEKIVRLLNTNFNFKKENFGESYLIFVVSISGVFSLSVDKMLQKMSGKRILITANRTQEIVSSYDEVIYLSQKDISEDEIGLLGKYGITYLFDLISQYYIYKYNDHKKNS